MSTKKTDQSEPSLTTLEDKNSDKRPVCGLIMPIADTEGYKIGHWEEIKMLITSVAEEAGFRTRLVSDSDDVRIIQSTIVQNVYSDDIVICDVSSKNPNVMFELGLRLAFDKAAVIIKDDITSYSFDTSPIAHIGYRKDLHYYSTEEFKKELKSKLQSTYQKSKSPDNSMYLGSFGKFEIQSVKTTTVTNDEYIIESLNDIRRDIISINNNINKDSKNLVNLKFDSEAEYSNELKELWNYYLRSTPKTTDLSASGFYKFALDIQNIRERPTYSRNTAYKFYEKQMERINKDY